MPWFQVSISHGPGHQSHTTKYVHAEKLSIDDAKEMFSDGYDDWEYGSAGLAVKKLAGLPGSILRRMRKAARAEIDNAKARIKLLNETPILSDKKHDGHWGYTGNKVQIRIGRFKIKRQVPKGWQRSLEQRVAYLKSNDKVVAVSVRSTMEPNSTTDMIDLIAAKKAGREVVEAHMMEPME